MLVSLNCCFTLLLALEGARAATATHSPLIRRGLTIHPAAPGRLYKRDLNDPPSTPPSEGGDGSHGHVTVHPQTPALVAEDGDDITTDYDFVLDLNEQEDFDRLLNMLSRAGPAKPMHEKTAGPSSTFLDRHDELGHPSSPPHSSLAAPFLPHGTKYTPQKVDPHTEGSHFDDLEKEKKEAEQRRLEELYFNQVKGKHEASSEEENDHWQEGLRSSVNGPTASALTFSLAVLVCLI